MIKTEWNRYGRCTSNKNDYGAGKSELFHLLGLAYRFVSREHYGSAGVVDNVLSIRNSEWRIFPAGCAT
jgi:hypothetical protein